MIGKCWCGDWHQISITLLWVNCHDVTGGIFEWWILRKTGMKSALKWHNQPGKNRVMLRCYYQRSQLKLCFQFQLSFHSFHCFYGTIGLSLQWKQSQWQSKISITKLICNISLYIPYTLFFLLAGFASRKKRCWRHFCSKDLEERNCSTGWWCRVYNDWETSVNCICRTSLSYSIILQLSNRGDCCLLFQCCFMQFRLSLELISALAMSIFQVYYRLTRLTGWCLWGHFCVTYLLE